LNLLPRLLVPIYLMCLVVLPVVAVWLWADDGMWTNGALPTHGLIHVVAGCGIALILRGALWLSGRKPGN